MNWKILMAVILIVSCMNAESSDSQLRVGYEPLAMKLFYRENVVTVQSGSQVGSQLRQAEENITFHLVAFRYRKNWNLPWTGFQAQWEAGVSLTPMPNEKKWVLPAMDSNFSGTVTRPSDGGVSSEYGNGHEVGIAFDGQSRQLAEETFFSYFPLLAGISRNFDLGSRLHLDAGLQTGLNCFFINYNRMASAGTQNKTQRSISYVSRQLGANFLLTYDAASYLKIFMDLSLNGVGGISQFTIAGGTAYGYRFDGLRYNYKLGVTWKL